MRISEEQKQVILSTIRRFAKDTPIDIYLYGSRVDDGKKGGDIDLLVVVPKSELERLEGASLKILVEIKKNKSIGQRKIDLKFCDQEQLKIDPFLQSISGQLIKLE